MTFDCKIHFLFFSCGAHASCLELAIRSLERVKGDFIGKVYIGEDPENPLSDSDKVRLASLGFKIIYKNWGKVTGYGETTAMSELRAYQEIARDIAGSDWIAKVDSDVLFITPSIFFTVRNSQADLVGQAEIRWPSMVYCQGGCYFLRAGFVSAFAGLSGEEVHAESALLLQSFHNVAAASGIWKMPQCPEDALIHRLIEKKGGRILLVRFYLPLWQVDRLMYNGRRPGLCKPSILKALVAPVTAMGIWAHDFMLARNRYSVIHFMSCKERMPDVFELLGLSHSASAVVTDSHDGRGDFAQ